MKRDVIREHPDPILYRECRKVEKFDKRLKKLAGRMKDTMHQHDGIGLAAPQIGITSRIFVAEWEGSDFFFVNPQIIETSHETHTDTESCLSLPNQEFIVRRPTGITVVGRDEKGKKQNMKLNGMLARIVSHEIDHLNGVLLCDKGMPTV